VWRFFLDKQNHLWTLVWIFKANRTPGATQAIRDKANYRWRMVHYDQIDWVLTAQKPMGWRSQPEVMSEVAKCWDKMYLSNLSAFPPTGLKKEMTDLKMETRIIAKDSQWTGPRQASSRPLALVPTDQHVLPTKVKKRKDKTDTSVSVQNPDHLKEIKGSEGDDLEDDDQSFPIPLGGPHQGSKKRLTEAQKIEIRRARDRERKRRIREDAKKRQELGPEEKIKSHKTAVTTSGGHTAEQPFTVQEPTQEQHIIGFPPVNPQFHNVPLFHSVPPFHSPDFLQLFELPYKQCKADTEKMFEVVIDKVSKKLDMVEDQLTSLKNTTTSQWNKISADISALSAKTSADIFEIKRIIDTMPTSKELKKHVDKMEDNIQKQWSNSMVNINSFRDVYRMLHGHELPSTLSTSTSTTFERPKETYNEPDKPRDERPKQITDAPKGSAAQDRDPSRIPKKTKPKQAGRGHGADTSTQGKDKHGKKRSRSASRSPKRKREEVPTPQSEAELRYSSSDRSNRSEDRDIPENRRRRRD